MAKIPGNYQYNALYHGNPVQRSWHRAKINLIERVAPPIPGSRVLDATCGSGVISYFLHKMGATVLGVDINQDAIGHTTRYQGNPLKILKKGAMNIRNIKGGYHNYEY